MRGRWPPKEHLPVTGPVDSVRLYYRPVVGPLLRRRAAWIESALSGRPREHLLEVGYGSGILQPTLAQHAGALYGVDIHPHGAQVTSQLAELGIETTLVQARGEELPFAPDTFGAVVMISTLSFVADPAAALRDAKRVLRPGGRLVALVPRALPVADRMWEVLTGRSTSNDFGDRRRLVGRAITAELPVTRRQRRPHVVPPALAPYELVIADKPLPRPS